MIEAALSAMALSMCRVCEIQIIGTPTEIDFILELTLELDTRPRRAGATLFAMENSLLA